MKLQDTSRPKKDKKPFRQSKPWGEDDPSWVKNLIKEESAKRAKAAPTRHERAVRDALDDSWESQKVMRGFVLDFYHPAAKLAVEIDGESHNRQKKYDACRDAAIREHDGIKTLRFTNDEVDERLDMIVFKINRWVLARS